MIAARGLAHAGIRHMASMLAAGALCGSLGCERRSEVASSDSSENPLASSIDFSTSLEGNVISTRIDRERVLVGDPIRLIVIATPAADRVAELAMPESPLGAFEVVSLPPPRDESLVPGSKAIALELSTFESGDLEIPPIRATFEPRGGGVEIELSSSAIPITVESVLEGEDLAGGGSAAAAVEAGVDPEDLRSVKGVVSMDDGRREAWWLVASLGAAVVVIAAGLLLLRRRGAAPEPPPGPWAIERFSSLAEACRRGGAIASAWDDAAAVLRSYLDRGCGIPARDLTTREILDAIEREPRFAAADRVRIATFLRQADLVKFAGASADGDVSAGMIESLRDVVASLEAPPSQDASGGAA